MWVETYVANCITALEWTIALVYNCNGKLISQLTNTRLCIDTSLTPFSWLCESDLCKNRSRCEELLGCTLELHRQIWIAAVQRLRGDFRKWVSWDAQHGIHWISQTPVDTGMSNNLFRASVIHRLPCPHLELWPVLTFFLLYSRAASNNVVD